MKNSMFTLSLFEREYPFYGKFVSKNQIVCWSWNLEPRLHKYAEFNGDFILFCFRLEVLFLG